MISTRRKLENRKNCCDADQNSVDVGKEPGTWSWSKEILPSKFVQFSETRWTRNFRKKLGVTLGPCRPKFWIKVWPWATPPFPSRIRDQDQSLALATSKLTNLRLYCFGWSSAFQNKKTTKNSGTRIIRTGLFKNLAHFCLCNAKISADSKTTSFAGNIPLWAWHYAWRLHTNGWEIPYNAENLRQIQNWYHSRKMACYESLAFCVRTSLVERFSKMATKRLKKKASNFTVMIARHKVVVVLSAVHRCWMLYSHVLTCTLKLTWFPDQGRLYPWNKNRRLQPEDVLVSSSRGYGKPVGSGLCSKISWRQELTAGFIGSC